jgi:serine/threonine protein kinase
VSWNDWEQIKQIFQEAIELPPRERATFLDRVTGANGELRGEVESLLLADKEAGDFIAEPALVEAGLAGVDDAELTREISCIGRHIGHYEVERELGRGGMGVVYLAARADAQFEKHVAIKVIKRGMDTEAILRRFVTERQILANLEHPNIARFLDGGTTDDSLPYFVMEYVDGESITKYCDSNKLNTNERLQLLQKVCAAVQHAHQNLIVHRDIKPSNILVIPDGTPKLLDFGVAKLLDPSVGEVTEETASAFRLMTPEYASPEQLRGLPINTATDVYNLGIVLYELLSGHRPFQFRSRSPEEIVRELLSEEPEKPSLAATRKREEVETLGPSSLQSATRNSKFLRGDLDNIILKALRKDRDRRYASVQEFLEDIRRHLAGLPVGARPDTLSYRAGKFIHRHRAGVVAAALILITLLSATIITSRQARIARSERATSERRFAEEKRFANSLLNEVQTSLKDIPNAAPAQRILADKSLEHLNIVARDAGDDPALLGELARAYINVGYLQAWTLQDNPAALLSYQEAIDLARKSTTLDPRSFSVKRVLGDALATRIESLTLLGRYEEALQTFEELLSVNQSILLLDPMNPEKMMGGGGNN